MSAAQRTNFVLIRHILRQLKAFGLNPYDWQIERAALRQDGAFRVCHKLDREFQMRGQFEANSSGFAKLQMLQVVSL